MISPPPPNVDTAFRKHDGNWYQFDDVKVAPIRVEDVVVSY